MKKILEPMKLQIHIHIPDQMEKEQFYLSMIMPIQKVKT